MIDQHIRFDVLCAAVSEYTSEYHTKSEPFFWQCFGDGAYHYDFLEEGYGKPSMSCVVTAEGIVAQVTLSYFPDSPDDESENKIALRWIHPDFKDSMIDEEERNGFDYRVVCDGYLYKDFDSGANFLNLVNIFLAKGYNYLNTYYPIQKDIEEEHTLTVDGFKNQEHQELYEEYCLYVKRGLTQSAALVECALAADGIKVYSNEFGTTWEYVDCEYDTENEVEEEVLSSGETEEITLDLPDDLLNKLFRLAHEENITFNEYANKILQQALIKMDAPKENQNIIQIRNLVSCYNRAVLADDFDAIWNIANELTLLGAKRDIGGTFNIWTVDGVAI